jgi:CheY-like chemotaxis protein
MRRILVVDDDLHICLAIRGWLRRYGFKVAIADDGASGLHALDNSTFDLMIVDIFMPNMRGFESIRVFHHYAPTVPLIAISGYAFSGDQASNPDFLRMALKLGATRCLRKPFRPTALLGVIDECLSEADPHRKYVATLAAVASTVLEAPDRMKSSTGWGGVLHEPSRRSDSVCGNRAAQSSSRLADVRHLGKRLQSFYSN